MKKFLFALAAGLMLTAGAASAITVSSRGSFGGGFRSSSFSSSSYRSSSFGSSRSSYTSTRSYTAPSRPAAAPVRPSVAPRAATVNRTVVNKTTVVNRTTVVTPHVYPSYGFYHPVAVMPVYIHHDYAYHAFNAILAWQMLSAAQRAVTPMPPALGLMDLTYAELSRAIWADGKMTLAEVAVFRQWKQVHGGVH